MARNRIRRYGTRAEVMNGTARMTKGRLTKADFLYNEKGYIVSKPYNTSGETIMRKEDHC